MPAPLGNKIFFTVSSAVILIFLGCVPTIPKEALQLRPESLALRQLQTRRYDTADEKKLLSAGAAVLQDLGFNLDESETALGVIVGSKDRDAVETGQVIGAAIIGALTGARIPVDKTQKIRASLVSRPLGHNSTKFRITFQRFIWNSDGQLSRLESLEEPELYQEFFARLSKAVFLQGHQL